MSSPVDLSEFITGFVAESDELVAAATTALLDIETGNARGITRPKSVRDLFRALHTIKGLAGMIGVEPIVLIAHELETLVRAADQAGGRFGRAAVEITVEAVRAISERVRAVAEGRTPAPVPDGLLASLATTDTRSDALPSTPPAMPEAWTARLTAGESAQTAAALGAGLSLWTLTFVPSEALAARGVTIATARADVGKVGEIIKVVPRATSGGVEFELWVASDATPDALAAAATTTPERVVCITAPSAEVPPPPVAEPGSPLPLEATTEAPGPVGRSFVRVELQRLDDLQENLSALVVTRFRLERELAALAQRGVDVRPLRIVAEQQGRQLRDLRRAILRVRMVRVVDVLEPLALLVRSLARPGVKELRLEIDARDAEVDKAVADRLFPAIVHLVRNAFDHAIEPVAERLAVGKPRAGTLRVTCLDIGGNTLELAISDDGRGIDRAAIAARARREVPDDAAILDVLTTPGFSTRDVVSQTSGRGLGMDIVRRIAVSELGGELSLSTTPGAGSTFTLRVPLTIAIIDVFSFTCGEQAYVTPVAIVEEIFELTEQASKPPSSGRTAVTLVERRGHALPVVSLGALLAVDAGSSARKAMVVRRNGELLAFSVDRMIGRQEVVVRPIDDPLGQVPGVSGATDLGDGRPTLVLDLVELGGQLTRGARA